jgi:FdhD protein
MNPKKRIHHNPVFNDGRGSMANEQDKVCNEDGPKCTEPFEVIRCYKGDCRSYGHDLIGEEPLAIRIDGQPYATIMRTPGDETFHAAGFCLAEGIVDELNDFSTIGYCKDMDANVIEIRLTSERHKRAEKILGKKNLISLSSCGICGREMIEEALGFLSSIPDNMKIGLSDAVRQIEGLHDKQELHRKTWGSHAAMLLDSGLEPLSISEDVGRHNALDKAIGKLFMTGKLKDARICVLSSRTSYEMIIKANRARIPIILSASRPTALAVKLGRTLNMTLACTARESELVIFSGEERIER